MARQLTAETSTSKFINTQHLIIIIQAQLFSSHSNLVSIDEFFFSDHVNQTRTPTAAGAQSQRPTWPTLRRRESPTFDSETISERTVIDQHSLGIHLDPLHCCDEIESLSIDCAPVRCVRVSSSIAIHMEIVCISPIYSRPSAASAGRGGMKWNFLRQTIGRRRRLPQIINILHLAVARR